MTISKKLLMAALLATSAMTQAAPVPPTRLFCLNIGYLKAATLLPQAETSLRAVRGTGTPAEADALYAVADLKTAAARDALIKEANAIWAAQQPSAQLAAQLHEQARKLMQSGSCGVAAPLLRNALSMAEQFTPQDEAQIYDVLTDLVRIEAVMRDKALLQNGPRLTAYWQQHGVPDDAIASQVYGNMAAVYFKDGQYALAEPLALRNLQSGERKYGPDHMALVPRLNDLASLYYGQLRYDEGEAALARVTAIQNKSNAVNVQRPPNAQQRSEAEMRRLFNQGDIAGALARGEQDIAQLEQTAASDTQSLQAAVNARAEQPSGGAKANIQADIERRARAKQAASIKLLAAARVRVAEIRHAQKRYDQARALYQQAIDDITRAGADPLETALVKSDLAMLYRVTGNDAAALAMQADALEVLLPTYGPLHPDVIDSASELAALYKRQGKSAELSALAERVPAIRAR